MSTTFLLALNTWDLTVDARGDIALADEPYAPAQDAASACRLFSGELWYDTTQGIPYFQQILGKFPPASFVRTQLENAALGVPDIASARCIFTSFNGRNLSGQLQLTLTDGATATLTSDSLLGAAPWYVLAATPPASGP